MNLKDPALLVVVVTALLPCALGFVVPTPELTLPSSSSPELQLPEAIASSSIFTPEIPGGQIHPLSHDPANHPGLHKRKGGGKGFKFGKSKTKKKKEKEKSATGAVVGGSSGNTGTSNGGGAASASGAGSLVLNGGVVGTGLGGVVVVGLLSVGLL